MSFIYNPINASKVARWLVGSYCISITYVKLRSRYTMSLRSYRSLADPGRGCELRLSYGANSLSRWHA